MSIMGVPISLVVAIGVPELLGSLVGQSTREDLLTWFATLRKPVWEPPGPLFGLAWTILYGVMGYASWRVWLVGGWQAQSGPLTLYIIQLALNLCWPIMFFKQKKLGTALALNLVVLATAALTASKFYQVDQLAGKLMLPYVAWLAFANALNYSILKKNPNSTTVLEDFRHEAPSKRNPGEPGYSTGSPASASLGVGRGFRTLHSRQATVTVSCSAGRVVPQYRPAAVSGRAKVVAPRNVGIGAAGLCTSRSLARSNLLY